MLFFGIRRAVMTVAAVVLTASGLLGAYSYGEAYYQHRGFVTVARLPRAGRGRLLNVHFYSRALHRQAFYLVYLPPGYTRSRHYPVFYLLHGMPGRPQVYIDIANLDVRLDNQLSEGHLRPMILVFPDGRIGGSTYSDSEWANTPSGHFEDYVLNVVSDVDSRFSTLPDRQDRVIGGFSAGGYGAINIALHHLSAFGNVEVWSGYFTEARTGVFAHASKAYLKYNSPIDYVRGLRRELAFDPLRVFMFVGRDDDDSAQIVPMAAALQRARASVTYAIYRGGHDWSVWYPRLNQMLILASQDVTHPLRPRERVPNDARVLAAHRRRAPRHRPRARRRGPAPPPGLEGPSAPALRRGSPRAPAPRRSPDPAGPGRATLPAGAEPSPASAGARGRGGVGGARGALPGAAPAWPGGRAAAAGVPAGRYRSALCAAEARLVRDRSAHPRCPAVAPAGRVRRSADRARGGGVASDRLRLRPRRSARQTALAGPRGGGVRGAAARGGVQRLVCAGRQPQADGRPLATAATARSVARGRTVRHRSVVAVGACAAGPRPHTV